MLGNRAGVVEQADTRDLKSDFFKGHLIENLLHCNGFSIELSHLEAQLPPELPPNFTQPARFIFQISYTPLWWNR